MRVGIDIMTIGGLRLSPAGMIDYAADHGFDGMQYGGVRSLSPTLDAGELREVKAYGDRRGMYTQVSVTSVNPVTYAGGLDALAERIGEEVSAAAGAGWHELHSVLNAGTERYTHKVPWEAHVGGCVSLINRLRPVLERHGSRINIETHGETTFDILGIISRTGPHLVGVCLDTANTLVNAEDPVMAARRVAPYTHLTHTKDAIVAFCETGIVRQGKPVGGGDVDFRSILPILAEYSPDLPLSIEDHKWLFTADIFDPDWMERNPDLTALELGRFVGLAWATQRRLFAGELPSIEDYEARPFMEEMEGRLLSGRDYLRGLLAELGLASE
ncbi:MAG: sugar phosphate isomerase/epimerase [Oscillospiraceae bacterium]|nr:sugar phosphate isomerase/epimerase [Oscillospiraceae bacterium]